MNKTTIIGSVAGGILITLLTGLIEAPSMLGATNYGYPFAWLTQLIIAPEYFPWRIHPIRLMLDAVVWSIVVMLVLYVLFKNKKT